ncbi:MAG: hypothetical protein EB054_02475 [Actinobacteria bacterium]|nr:hypothetical protein [Actinomycetota bacterium]
MANDLFSALRTYLTKVTAGEKTPQEIAAALNAWARESSEAIKERVEEEIQRSAKKMGFAKQSDLDKLARELEELRFRLIGNSRPSSSTQKKTRPSQKSAPKKAAPKKSSAGKKKSTSTRSAKK